MAGLIWGKNQLTKEEFVHAVQMGDTIIDLEEMKVFDPEKNEWVAIDGDN